MKLAKFLNHESTALLSDPINQAMITQLVNSEYSISELSSKLNVPNLKLWRRMQKLAKANLVEVSRTEKVGNIEKKLYRATATWFGPQQFINFKPKDPDLTEGFEIYSEIQKEILNKILEHNDVPRNVDPVDFSLYAEMNAFSLVWSDPGNQTQIKELKQRIEKFKEQSIV